MKALALDTPPDIEKIVIKGYRAMTPAQKLRRVIELGVAAQALAAARIRYQPLRSDPKQGDNSQAI